MKDIVSFETAKRLKAAGFPHPEKIPFEFFLYSKSGFLFRYKGGEKNKMSYFAPTATDILKEFPVDKYSSWGLYWIHDKGVFHIYDAGELFSEHENPAEACAAAWLSIHEKPTNQ